MSTHLEIQRKRLLDAIARELYGWADDGTRHAYEPDELPAMARRLRVKAEKWIEHSQPGALARLDRCAPVACTHPHIVGGNDCRWCTKCGEDVPTSQPSKGSE